jgi:hypothetical protein
VLYKQKVKVRRIFNLKIFKLNTLEYVIYLSGLGDAFLRFANLGLGGFANLGLANLGLGGFANLGLASLGLAFSARFHNGTQSRNN